MIFLYNDKKKNLKEYVWELSDELLNRIWSLYSVLLMYMFNTKILFFKGWYEKIVKRWYTQGVITTNKNNYTQLTTQYILLPQLSK